jgi:signal transduction histidine kinase
MACEPTIQVVCHDPELIREYLSALQSAGESYDLRPIAWAAEARHEQLRAEPVVTLLDESGVQHSGNGKSFPSTVALLAEKAPVVLVASPQRQVEFTFLVSSGAIDFVPRTGGFVPIAVGLVERRIRLAGSGKTTTEQVREASSDFGELFRHEVNNPLTGILGNAEMLLARRDSLPSSAVKRVETIVDLAVRLRETVRRLSNVCEGRQNQL